MHSMTARVSIGQAYLDGSRPIKAQLTEGEVVRSWCAWTCDTPDDLRDQVDRWLDRNGAVTIRPLTAVKLTSALPTQWTLEVDIP
jgi:hypothetical protein